MPWQQLKIAATAVQAEQLTPLLEGLGAVAVTLEDAADQPLLEPGPGETPLWDATIVVALFESDTDLAKVIDALQRRTDFPLQYQTETLEDRQWERVWMDEFHPMRFGERLWICPSWREPPDPSACNILLDPGLAFGTGTHATTALCLTWLDQHPPRDQVTVDYGCGSGILSIAAAKLGASRVWAIDHDPQAVSATRDNARNNGVADKITASLDDTLHEASADLVLANILAGPLKELAPRFAALIKPGGHVVLSGILQEQIEEIAETYAKWFKILEKKTMQEWGLVVGERCALPACN